MNEIKKVFEAASFGIPKIRSVEEFQSQEYKITLISTVRSCSKFTTMDANHNLEFLSNPKMLNVVISRAQVVLIIIGNPYSLVNDDGWRKVISYCVKNGSYVGCGFSLPI